MTYRIPLAATSRLGFGTSRLLSVGSKRQAFRLLDCAAEAGITHFDVAPSYCLGQAEAVLGEFLATSRLKATVASKYGIPPPPAGRLLSLLRTTMKNFGVHKPASGRGASGALPPSVSKRAFSVRGLVKSVERSLDALRRSSLEVLFLHEPEPNNVTRDLVDAAQKMVPDTVSAVGLGGDRKRVNSVADYWPNLGAIRQHEHTPFTATTHSDEYFPCLFGSLMFGVPRLKTLIARTSSGNQIENLCAINLSNDSDLARLCIAASMVENPHGLILFSTTDPSKVRIIGSLLKDPGFLAVAAKARSLLLTREAEIDQAEKTR